MSHSFNAISLSTINASGTSSKALFSALTTDMFFGQKSSLEIRLDKGIVQPYFTVELPALESLNMVAKKELLLTECLKETEEKLTQLSTDVSVNAIDEVIIVTSLFGDDEDIDSTQHAWQLTVSEYVNEYLPQLTNKLTFNYVKELSPDRALIAVTQVESFEHPKLIICLDSLTDYNTVIQLNEHIDIQCQEGRVGVMPAEAVCSALLVPSTFPDIESEQQVTICPLNINGQLTVSEQLTQAKFSIPGSVIHVGAINEQWVKHWYGQTNSFYHQQTEHRSSSSSNEITVYDQTKVLGYLGAANLATAFACADALLTSPILDINDIWLVEHQVKSKNNQQAVANVYQITRATNKPMV